ncbi:hypothetical protein H5410_023541 [Solanum commersonii]|uniref:Uncharacterized protein n=1 Tax=Solanum commersonii TaxID=4109 RepID=A0A9J5ZJQ1_SOLCO|nr:hypothetical protein H5410_023541 [Solanum commersonii]
MASLVVVGNCKRELGVVETCILVQDGMASLVVVDGMASLVVVVTCKLESVVVETCKLESVVVETCILVQDSMASLVVVVTCKQDGMASPVVVVICKLVRDDKVLVRGGMASLVVGEMSIDNLLSFRKLS